MDLVYVCATCTYAYAPSVCRAHRDLKRTSNTLELGLQMLCVTA